MNDAFDSLTGEIPSGADGMPDGPLPILENPGGGSSLNKALMKVLASLPVAIEQDAEAKISNTTEKTRKYATLKAIMTIVRPLFLEQGIRVRQGCVHAWQLDTGTAKGRCVPVYTDLIHVESGQVERTTVEIPLLKFDAQAMGSAISYGRRYGLLAALGLTTEEADDDGKATMQKDKLGQENEESQELWVIKSEIDTAKNLKELVAWGKTADEVGRINKLSDKEAAIAHNYYSDRMRKLRYVPSPEEKGGK